MTPPVTPGVRGRRRAAGAVAAFVAGAALAAAVPAWADLDPMFEMNFGDQQVHTTSGVRTMTIHNDDTQGALKASAQTTGDFEQTNNCAADVPPGGTCQIRVTFTPGSTGKKKGMLTIHENRPGSPLYITLAGNGVTHATPEIDPAPAPAPSPTPAPPPPPPPPPSPQPPAPTSVATQQPLGPVSPASDPSTPESVTPATSQPSTPHTGGTLGAAGKKPTPAPSPTPAAPAPAVPAASTQPDPVPLAPASPDLTPAPEASPTAAETVLGSQVTTATPARPAPPTSDGAPALQALGTIAGISGAGAIVVRRRRRR